MNSIAGKYALGGVAQVRPQDLQVGESIGPSPFEQLNNAVGRLMGEIGPLESVVADLLGKSPADGIKAGNPAQQPGGLIPNLRIDAANVFEAATRIQSIVAALRRATQGGGL